MPKIDNIENKIKINKTVSIAVMIISAVLALGSFALAFTLITDSRKNIYVLDNGVPVLVKQTDLLSNRPVEYKSQIELFHRMFFTLAPDDKWIKENVEKSLYLIDDSGKKEYTNLREKGFYNQLISSNSMATIHTDSIKIDEGKGFFTFYGKQFINRKSSLIIRNLVTQGFFKDAIRSPQNPHGVLLLNWRILDNTQISDNPKFTGF